MIFHQWNVCKRRLEGALAPPAAAQLLEAARPFVPVPTHSRQRYASQRSRPRTGHGSAGAASRWRAPAGRWAARHLGIVRGRNPRHPRGGARRVRWVALLALQPGTASAWLRGAPIPELCPPPTRRRHRPRAPAANSTRLALAAGGASAPVCPQGLPGGRKPQPGLAE